MHKPYSEACERNREPLYAVIAPWLSDRRSVLEIGSGTGQHAVYFAERMPHLTWQTSDRAEHLAGIRLWLAEAALPNLPAPIELDVMNERWPATADAVFSANTAHIMHRHEVRAMFAGVGRLLPERGVFLLYGPFNYDGRHTSASNAQFDAWLKQRDAESGIRDIEEITAYAKAAGMVLQEDNAMPANNRLLVWKRLARNQDGQ